MNETEIDRIAAMANALRPDWPIASIRTTLNRPEIAHRPRRDVAVALAWVACESASKTPARVIEAGPWWKAAMIEGTTTAPRHPKRDEACETCGRREDEHRGSWGDHEFAPMGSVPASHAEHHISTARAQLHTKQARLCTEHHRLDCRVCGATTTAEETK